MLGDKLREVISASRRAARDFRRALEEVAEQLAANEARNARPALQRIPVRVTRPATRNPFLQRRFEEISRRFFSTFNGSYGTRQAATRFLRPQTTFGVSHQARNILFRAQPFRSVFRPRINGYPTGLYTNFTRSNARNFSTYGPNFTAQAVHNLSQGIRAMYIKGGQIKLHGVDSYAMSHAGSFNTHQNAISKILTIARATDATDASFLEIGSYVDFSLSPTSTSAADLPKKFSLDDEVVNGIERLFTERQQYQKRVLRDINVLKDRLGSPKGETLAPDGGKVRLTFEGCEPSRMESVLTDLEITTGVIHEFRPPHPRTRAHARPFNNRRPSSITRISTASSSFPYGSILSTPSDSPALTADRSTELSRESWLAVSHDDDVLSMDESSEYFATAAGGEPMSAH